MPRRLPPHKHWDSDAALNELIATTPGTDLTTGSVKARAAALPLFRRANDGSLEQAVRFRVSSPAAQAGIELSIRAGDRVLDRAVVDAPAGETSFHLFVPEVSTETTFEVGLKTGSSEWASADLQVEPQRKWSIYLVHHSHFDYGYTDPQATVMEHQLRYIDAALDLIAATDDWDDDAKFRWNVEVTYPLQKWFASRPKALRNELIARVKEGRIEIHALPFSMHTEVYSIDELAWGLKFADELRETHGIEINTAIQSDVPGATVGLLNLLTSADVRYFNVAHNYAGRSVPFRVGGQELTRPFWWQGADGKRLLVWQGDTPHGVAYMDGVLVGLSASERVARGLLPDYLNALSTRPYPYGKHAFGWHDLPAEIEVTKKPYPHDILHFRVQNGLADNAPPSLAVAETVRDWNEQWAYPRLRMAMNRDFFTEAERRLGNKLNTFEGDWTDWWADGVGSGALPLGLNRRAQGTIRTAQTLHTLAETVTGESMPAIASETDRVYEDLALFDEHTWGSANPWDDKLEHFNSGQLEWGRKSAFAYQAYDRANVLLESGLNRFTGSLRLAHNAIASLIVFNPSGWQRTDLARVFVPAERLAPGRQFAVINAVAGQVAPHSVEPQPNPGFRAKGQWLTFAAIDVPPIGYTRFDVVEAKGDESPVEVSGDPHTLENRFYRVTIHASEGHITSIIDRDSGRELVDVDAPFGFNEYIYDRYTTGAGFNHLSGRIEDVDLTLFGTRSTGAHAAPLSRTSNAVRESITIRLVAEGTTGLETTISLPHDVKRVDISNRLFKVSTPEKESVYFAFPFAIDDPDPEYEITGGVTSRQTPHVPGSAQHMFAIRHWLALNDGQGSAAWASLEAPLIELGSIALPFAPFPQTIPADRAKTSTIYSWALNNIWDTNFPPEQGGEMYFRYAVGSGNGSSGRELGIRTGAALSAPLVGMCLGRHGTVDATASGSFVEVSHPLVEVVSVAPARHGDGIVAFLHSLAPETVETRIAFPSLSPSSVQVGTHLERHMQDVELKDGAVTITITPGAYVAVNMGTLRTGED